MKKNVKIIELFSGIGGFTKGFEDAGYTIEEHYYSEIDKHAIANYKKNYPNAKYIGSVTDIRPGDFRGIDIITFGSPCQDFSLAGKRKGLEGERSSLIEYAIRAITDIRPSVFIWENVKGAFSSNAGADFWAILQAFANIGDYRLEWQLLNTKWFLPQNRERIYLIGHLADRSEPGVFPIGEEIGICNERNSEKPNQIASTLNANDEKSWVGNFIKVKSATKNGFETIRGRVGKGVEQTLDCSCNQGVITHNVPNFVKVRKHKVDIENLQYLLKNSKNKSCSEISEILNLPKTKVEHWFRSDKSFSIPDADIWFKLKEILNINTNEFDSQIIEFEEKLNVFESADRVYDEKGISPTLNTVDSPKILSIGTWRTHKDGNGFREIKENISPTIPARAREDGSGQPVINENAQIRRLTEIECERLQGFPQQKIFICLEKIKNHAQNAEVKCRKLQKFVLTAEKTDLNLNVLFANQNLNIKQVQKNKLVLENVHINFGENAVEIHNQGKLIFCAKNAESKNWFHPLIKIEDFVLLLVRTNLIQEKKILIGKEEFRVKEQSLAHQKNSRKLVKEYGKETTLLANDAEKDLIILSLLLKFTTSSHLNTKKADVILKTWFSFVIHVINGFIPEEIQIVNLSNLSLSIDSGWTEYGNYDGVIKKIPKTQRYKMLGNAVTVKVVEIIAKRLNLE